MQGCSSKYETSVGRKIPGNHCKPNVKDACLRIDLLMFKDRIRTLTARTWLARAVLMPLPMDPSSCCLLLMQDIVLLNLCSKRDMKYSGTLSLAQDRAIRDMEATSGPGVNKAHIRYSLSGLYLVAILAGELKFFDLLTCTQFTI